MPSPHRATDNVGAQAVSLPSGLTVGGAPTARLIALTLKDNPATDLNQTATGGYFWNAVAGATFSKGPLRTIDNSEITDISVATSNAFGFVANDLRCQP